MDSKSYYDNDAVRQVIGSIFKDPSLLNQSGQYFLTAQDFINDAHRVIYGAASNLYANGAENLTLVDVENYIRNRENASVIYKAANGPEYLRNAIEYAEPESFKYYYDKVKKMTLLRNYCDAGVDVTWLYDPNNLIDKKKKEEQLNLLDSLTLSDVAERIENRVSLVRIETVNKGEEDAMRLGDKIDALWESLQSSPEVGMPFSFGGWNNEIYSGILNRVTFGARKGKLFIRSAASGVGKTRSMLADACMLACRKIVIDGKWTPICDNENGKREGVLFISTELDESELFSMALAFISNINEEKIISHQMTEEEFELLQEAREELRAAPLFIKQLPNFTVSDVENAIKKSHIQDKCNYVFYDYLGTSLGILEEVGRKAKISNMREDSVLFLLATRLKELAVQYNIFIETATQLNQNWKTDSIPDQNLLRGSKAVADRCDVGSILLNVTKEDEEDLRAANWPSKWGIMPNQKLSVYKNRRGKYVNCYVWIYADKGTCRFSPVGSTDWKLQPYDIIPLQINAKTKGVA